MSDQKKLLLKWQDNSNNELGYQGYADNDRILKIKHGAYNSPDISLIGQKVSPNGTNSFETGADYIAKSIPVDAGQRDISINTYNSAGESNKALLGTVNVYARSDLLIYIGDQEADGSGVTSELINLDGKTVSTLNQMIDEAYFFQSYKSGGYVRSGWDSFAPASGSSFGAEVGMFDEYQSGKERATSIYKLTIPNAMASTVFAENGEGYDFLQQYFKIDFQDLYFKYHQPRIRGVIVNLPTNDQNVIQSYQNMIDWIRNWLELPELPFVLTNRSPIEQPDIPIAFTINKSNSILGEYYLRRNMLGHYAYVEEHPDQLGIAPTYLNYGSAFRWRKVLNLDGSAYTGSNEIIWVASENGLSGYPSGEERRGLFYYETGDDAKTATEWSSLIGCSVTEFYDALKAVGCENFYNLKFSSLPSTYNQSYVWKTTVGDITVGLSPTNKTQVELHLFQDVKLNIIRHPTVIYAIRDFAFPGNVGLKLQEAAKDKSSNFDKGNIYNLTALYEQRDRILPYISILRNHMTARGFSVPKDSTSVLEPLTQNNVKVSIVNSLDLEKIDNKLSSSGEVELGRRYINNLKVSTLNIGDTSPALWWEGSDLDPDNLGEIPNKGTLSKYPMKLLTGNVYGTDGVEENPNKPSIVKIEGGSEYDALNTNLNVWEFNYNILQPDSPSEGAVTEPNLSTYVNSSGERSYSKCLTFVLRNNKYIPYNKIFGSTGDGHRFLAHFPWKTTAIFQYKGNPIVSATLGNTIMVGRAYVFSCWINYAEKTYGIGINDRFSIKPLLDYQMDQWDSTCNINVMHFGGVVSGFVEVQTGFFQSIRVPTNLNWGSDITVAEMAIWNNGLPVEDTRSIHQSLIKKYNIAAL